VWFQNLVDCLGNRLIIRLVSRNNEPVASILTLSHRRALVYKYGCSDERFHSLGGIPLLFWLAVQEAKESGFLELDLGRSELNNDGLVQFKDHLGAACACLTYYRYPAQSNTSELSSWGSRVARQIFSRVPDSVLVPAGKLLYKHLG
jgi:lipid II:glycine glycyltransferase (peptidoglycan interpeptide bridge formation enzyme)